MLLDRGINVHCKMAGRNGNLEMRKVLSILEVGLSVEFFIVLCDPDI